MKTLAIARPVKRVRRRVEHVHLFAFRQSFAPAQGFRALGATLHLGQKYPVTVRFLGGAHHAARAIDARHLGENLLHGPGQSRFHPRRTEDARDHGTLRPHFLLVLRHVAEQESEHDQIKRTHEQLLRIQLLYAHTKRRQVHLAQPLIRCRFQASPHRERFHPQQCHRRTRRTHRFP